MIRLFLWLYWKLKGEKIMKTFAKVVTIALGILTAVAAIAGVVYFLQKKAMGCCKEKKSYIPCSPEGDGMDEVDEMPCDCCDAIDDAE